MISKGHSFFIVCVHYLSIFYGERAVHKFLSEPIPAPEIGGNSVLDRRCLLGNTLFFGDIERKQTNGPPCCQSEEGLWTLITLWTRK